MTSDIADAVTWTNLEVLSVPVIGYADGSVSMWPAEAFQALGKRVKGVITVLADERYAIFDSETGNAGTDAVATAVANRFQDRQESTCYTNASNLPGLSQSLRAKGMHWTDAQFWPEPGCYLWAAAPGTTPGAAPPWCPVSPVAVQDRWLGGYDLSTVFGGWPVATKPLIPPPPPPPVPVPPERLISVQALQVQQGNEGFPVQSVQALINHYDGAGLVIDGIFGPATHQAVVNFQAKRKLAADGIVGLHTWGDLIGVPQ